MTVAIFTQNSLNSIEDAMALMNNGEISKKVQDKKALYYHIDVAKTMADLTQVGQLLQLAFAGTKKMKSAEFTIKMLTRYQRLIKDSTVTTGSFVEGSIQVLKWNKVALTMTEKKKYSTALKFLSKASEIAKEMSEISGERVKQADELSSLAEQALVAVTKDDNMEAEKRKKVLASIEKTKTRQAELRSITESLVQEIEEQREREKNAAEKADSEAKKAFIIGLISAPISALTAPIGLVGSAVAAAFTGGGNGNTKPSEATSSSSISTAENACKAAVDAKKKEIDKITEEIRNKESQISDAEKAEEKDEEKINKLKEELKTLKATQDTAEKSKSDLQSHLSKMSDKLNERADSYMAIQANAARKKAELTAMQREANSELAGAVEGLKHLNASSSEIDRAVAALSVALKTLGKVRTTFENVRLFWKGVEKQTKTLSRVHGDAEDYVEADEKGELIRTIYDSAIGWLTIALTSRSALVAIEPANNNIDSVMDDLPSDAEAALLLTSNTTTALLQSIKKDSEQLKLLSAQSAEADE